MGQTLGPQEKKWGEKAWDGDRPIGVTMGPDRVWDVSYSLKEAGLVLLLIVGPKLDLALEPSKLTGLVERDWVGAIQDVISCLDSIGKRGECCAWVKGCPSLCFCPLSLPPLPQASPRHTCT